MIVRIRCKKGNFRFELSEDADLQDLVAKVLAEAPEADPGTITFSNQPRVWYKASFLGERSGPDLECAPSHGDLIFAAWQDQTTTAPPVEASAEYPTTTKERDAWKTVQEDSVDVFLEQQPGQIQRPRDAKFCKHGDKAMCDFCMPLEAHPQSYDPKYQQEKGIKHLSYHAYLRKLDTQANRPAVANVSYVPPLDELDYNVAIPCSSGTHPSWPGGICSKCQPSAITLQLQPYRMVDHVEYASPTLIDQFIDFWRRQGGTQRFGWLIGHYEPYDQVPLGIKAVVEAIHEPPQAGDIDGLEVNMEWEELPKVEALAAQCGLCVVGMIYTDLLADTESPGKVVCKRHAGSYFLSGLEAIFSAVQQRDRPNPSRFCVSGKFSSKFVTCVVTGNEQGEVEVKAYQVSDQAMGLVDADLIEPSVNPSVIRVKKEDDPQVPLAKNSSSTRTTKRYVPDVFYRYKNQYNINVQESAKPCFPVDYLLVSLTHGFPQQGAPYFASSAFPIENRHGLHDQSKDAVLKQVAQLSRNLPLDAGFSPAKGKGKATDMDALDAVARWLSDWHLLAFLHTDFVGSLIAEEDFAYFVKAATASRLSEEDRLDAVSKLVHSAGWQTMTAFAPDDAPGPPLQTQATPMETDDFAPGLDMDQDELAQLRKAQEEFEREARGGAAAAATPAVDSATGVVCPHCTFENPPGATGDCMICSLPLAA